MKISRAIPVLGTMLLAVACDGGGPVGPGEGLEAVASVVVAPDTVVLSVGASRTLSAVAHASDGTVLQGLPVSWSSQDTAVVKVDNTGTATARKPGRVTVTAKVGDKTGRGTLVVEAPAPVVPVAAVDVRPRVVVTYVATQAPLAVTVVGEDGTVLSGRTVSWTVADESVATVGADGVVVGRREGETLVTATVEGKSATVAVSFKTASSYHLVFDRESPAFYWMDMRTGEAQKHLEHGGTIRSRDASPSPTRSGFAYVYDFGPGTSPQIAIQNWSGTTYRFLTGGDQPAWSPGGGRIAFRRSHEGRTDVWTIDADGVTEAVNLTADLPEGVSSERPAWSPNGDRIVFSAGNARGGAELWVMNADGTGKRRLTSGPDRDTEPSWIDDRIVFTRRTAVGTSELYSMFVNGALAQRLTANGGAQMPAWSPDGRWIAFVVRDGDAGVGDLFVMRPDGSDVRPLSLRTDGPSGGGLNPAWTLHW